jgi:ribonuclease P protein component
MTAPVYRKKERMVSRKLIETLFSGGSSLSMAAFPLRVVYLKTERPSGEAPVQLLISVPKKRFKHAVDRNRAKRLIREAYRLNKGLLLDHLPEDTQLDLAFIWMSDELCDYAIVETKMKTLLQRIAEKINGRDSE